MLSWVYNLEWHQPAWSLLALQPLVLWLLTRRQRRSLLAYAEPRLHPWAVHIDSQRRTLWGQVLQFIIWGLLAIALAGPRMPEFIHSQSKEQVSLRGDVSYMLVLDVSNAMQVRDLSTTRAQRARIEIADLFSRLRGERIGLVVYGAQAGLLAPPTRDYETLQFYLAQADSVVSDRGSAALPEALQIAAQTLDKPLNRSSAIILVTAGDSRYLNGTPGSRVLSQVESLGRSGFPLYILATGTEDGQSSENHSDFRRLQELANLFGGRFSVAENGDSDWQKLYDTGLARLPSDYRPPHAQRIYRELYSWFLIPALMLLLVLPVSFFLQRHSRVLLTALVLTVFIGMPLAAAAASLEHRAFQAYSRGDYALAQILYARLPGHNARMGEGSAAFQREDFVFAQKQFTLALLLADTNSLRANALYNLGNSHFRLRQFSKAIEAYQGALQYDPNHISAGVNLQLSKAQLRKSRGSGNTDADVAGLRLSDEYGRYYDPGEQDFPQDEIQTEDKSPAYDQDALGRRVARGEVLPDMTTRKSRSTTDIEFGDTERAASQKKLELIEDRVAEALQGLIEKEQRAFDQ